MPLTHTLGFPRIGPKRELKRALESYWRGETAADALVASARELRLESWALQRAAKLDWITTGDFALYDHVLEQSALLGALPARFGFDPARLTLAQHFELARGNGRQPAMEMTKWFDTNYHYLVPEVGPDTRFDGGVDWLYDAVDDAIETGAAVKTVLVGPITWLRLAKSRAPGFDRLTLLPRLLEAYRRVLARLAYRGVHWVQLDEPALCADLEPQWLAAYEDAYGGLAHCGVRIMLATYFGSVEDAAAEIARLPVHGLHLDCVRAPSQLETWRRMLPEGAVLSAGIVDGRNVWRTDLRRTLTVLRPLHDALGDRLWLAPSCSLLHVPLTVSSEHALDREVRPWLAFAAEKLEALRLLARGLDEGEEAIEPALAASDDVLAARRASPRAVNEHVRARAAALTPEMSARASPFSRRVAKQREALRLPPLPTTTIGSFPQTADIRRLRSAYRRREIGALAYLSRIRQEVEHAVREQETLGLDVLVHGEAERNDMVEYFAESLWGYAVTGHGWVQSYGSRCVKPPIVYGDVCRPDPLTVETACYAQSLTLRPVKGMLTGPVTMLQWSFVRDDQPREKTALQIALALRDEVADLERAGIRVIQIDEPALREGLPLKSREWPLYLEWATRAFRIAASGVADETQIHTHMCYSEFGDILDSIAALDADVITIETSRSNMELLDAFAAFRYPNEIGPGVYDIHSPRIASAAEMLTLLRRAAEVIPPERLWVNPDCGLKTRGWPEARAALANMVAAAHALRRELALEPAPG